MNFVLTAMDDDLANAWEKYCGRFPFVTVHRGSILDVRCDAVVSPANSFGFMDGGIDAVYTEYFGPVVQERIRSIIEDEHFGELLVGEAVIVATDNDLIPYLISAPTMRVPLELGETVNPYLAARGVLLLLRYGVFGTGPNAGKPVMHVLNTVAFPGMGTGAGNVSPEVCALQLCQAIEDFWVSAPQAPRSMDEAIDKFRSLTEPEQWET
jgi:O-acetyl-ADP-ribose deacetylase (regulator of RNase III)